MPHPADDDTAQVNGGGQGPGPYESVPCTWTMDDQDACQACSGQACHLCGAGLSGRLAPGPCEHDVTQRHQRPTT